MTKKTIQEIRNDTRNSFSGGAFSGFKAFLFSIISILIGLLFGFLLMVITNPKNAVSGFSALLFGGIPSGMASIGNILSNATPLIGVGLAVAISSKAGIFNIGGSGQFTMGGLCALVLANFMKNTVPAPFSFIIVLIVGMIAGAIWALVPALLKNHFNVNIVVSAIMMNYIAAYVSAIVAKNRLWYDQNFNKISVKGCENSYVPTGGLDKIFQATNEFGGRVPSRIDIAVIITLVICIVLAFIFAKTTFGLRIKVSGQNGDCAKYSGINNKKSIAYAMMLSGAMAGMGAVFTYLSKSPSYFTPATTVNSIGFDGISVALIGNNSPIGCIFSAILLSYIKTSGSGLTAQGFDSNIIGIVTSIIIYFSATIFFLSNVSSLWIKRIKARKSMECLTGRLESDTSKENKEVRA